MRIFCILCCILLLAACGVKRESRQVSVMTQADSLSIRHTDSLRFNQRLYHTAGQLLQWEEITLSAPDSLRRQHVRRITRAHLTNGSHTRVTDTLTAGRRLESNRVQASAAVTRKEKRPESNHSFGSRWLLILLVATAGWLEVRK